VQRWGYPDLGPKFHLSELDLLAQAVNRRCGVAVVGRRSGERWWRRHWEWAWLGCVPSSNCKAFSSISSALMCYTVLVIARDSSDGALPSRSHGPRLDWLLRLRPRLPSSWPYLFALYLVKPITRLSGYILLCGRWISPSPLFIICIRY
jgi:hypothetical protein